MRLLRAQLAHGRDTHVNDHEVDMGELGYHPEHPQRWRIPAQRVAKRREQIIIAAFLLGVALIVISWLI